MTIIDRLRGRPADTDASSNGASEASSPEEQPLPIAGYDRLGDKEIAAKLPALTQVELTTIERHEVSHQNRPVIVDKLRYMQSPEPIPGYDELESEQVIAALDGADGQKLRAIRDYERKFQRRKLVMDEVARLLPTSQASATETRAREAKAELVRNKMEPEAPSG